MKAAEIYQAVSHQWNLIHQAEAKLRNTDYIAAKIAEGKATKTEYKDKIAERQGWRDDINAAQEEIARLEALEPEDEEMPAIEEEKED